MTKAEGTHKRNKQFSEWIRENLPDSWSGFRVYDIDYVLWKKVYINGEPKIEKIMVVEEKNGKSEVGEDFRLLAKFLDRAIKRQSKEEGIEYKGLHLVQLETGNPETGGIKINHKDVTAKELRSFLSME